MTSKVNHIPVLLKEVVEYLKPQKGKKIIDATLGMGGHTKAFLEKGAEVLSLEWDEEVLAKTKEHLTCPDASWKAVLANFANIDKVARKNSFDPVDGILFDLGISTWHYKSAQRGFSYSDQSLDMRLSAKNKMTGEKIINTASSDDLEEIFTKFVQQRSAAKITEQIIKNRPIKTAIQLEEIIKKTIGQKNRKTNPATKVFLALRIAVNSEFDNLVLGLSKGINLLKKDGRMAVISFHSGEDRIVKLYFKKLAVSRKINILTKKAVRPGNTERRDNPSSRSSLLRVIEKI